MIRRYMLQLKDLKVQNQDRSGSTNQSPGFWMCFVVRFLRFAIRFADAITEHLLEHGDALPQQLGVLWTFEGSRFRCIEKVEEAQGNTMLTKRLDLWSLWFPFVFLMSLPFITISTYIYFFTFSILQCFFRFHFYLTDLDQLDRGELQMVWWDTLDLWWHQWIHSSNPFLVESPGKIPQKFYLKLEQNGSRSSLFISLFVVTKQISGIMFCYTILVYNFCWRCVEVARRYDLSL